MLQMVSIGSISRQSPIVHFGGRGQERSQVIAPAPSGPEVSETNPKAVTPPHNSEGTSLDSVDIGTGKSTIRLETSMHGNGIAASAAGHDAYIPTESKGGIDINRKPDRSGQLRVATKPGSIIDVNA